MSDPKTTTMGVSAALGVLMIGVGSQIDGDPNTIVDMPTVIQAAGVLIAAVSLALKGWFSKDK